MSFKKKKGLFIPGTKKNGNGGFGSKPKQKMYLDGPLTVIREPYWNKGYHLVGVDRSKIKDHNFVEISWEKEDGERLYPHLYGFTRRRAEMCAEERVKDSTVILKLIPVEFLVIFEKFDDR